MTHDACMFIQIKKEKAANQCQTKYQASIIIFQYFPQIPKKKAKLLSNFHVELKAIHFFFLQKFHGISPNCSWNFLNYKNKIIQEAHFMD